MTQNKPRSDRYVLQDLRNSADGKALFWRKDYQGYTTHLSEAHVFTMQDKIAQDIDFKLSSHGKVQI
jgi:regulation of enolase protein 1 (concanavalin A-like superfamily)